MSLRSPDNEQPGRPPVGPAALVAIYLGLVAARLLIAANGYFPVIQPDEVIYREAARWFAGVGPLPNLADTFLFPLGYPLLVAPLWWLSDTLAGVSGALLVFNALVGSAAFFPLRFLLVRLSGASEALCTAAAAVTTLYPAYLVITGMWATDNAFVPLFVLLMACAWWLFEAPSGPRAAAYGALAAALYFVHERALLIVAVVAVQLVVMAVRGHLRRRVAGIALGTLAVGFAAVRWLMVLAVAVLYRGDPVERPLLEVLAKLLRLDGWIDVVLQAAGQGWYLLVATYGLGAIGLAVLVELLRRHRAALWTPGPGSAAGHVALLLLLATGAVFATTSVYFPSNSIIGDKAEYMFFGRICEGTLPVLLALGLAWPGGRSERRFPLTVLGWMAVALVLGAVMMAGRGMEALGDDPGTYGIFGVRWFLRDGHWLLGPVSGTLAVAAVAGAAAWLLRRRRAAFAALVGLSFLWLSADLSLHYMGRRLERLYTQAIPAQLARAGGADEIAIDTRAVRTGRYAELVRRVDVRSFSSRGRRRPPADVVLTRRDWKYAERHDARFLVGERDRNYALWALPGPAADRLYRPPDHHEVVYGAQPVWSVWEEDFEEQELWRGPVPARWTDGSSELRIPLGPSPPAVLRLDVAEIGPDSTPLEVRVDGRELAVLGLAGGGWSGDLSLAGVSSGAELRLELRSDRVSERGWRYGSRRRWRRGVLVRGISLLDAAEAAIDGRSERQPDPGPAGGELRILDEGAPRWAAPGSPLVLTVEARNIGGRPWFGHTDPAAPGTLRLEAAWGGAAGAETIELPLPRTVLPGRRLVFPVALEPRRADGSPLPPGDYAVELRFERAAAGAAAVSVPVRVRRHPPDRPFAPLRAFTRYGWQPPPPFVLMPWVDR